MLKELLKLAGPMTMSYLANALMQLVDTIFVGRLGAAAIGGVSIGNTIFMTMSIVCIAFSLGLEFLVSHAYGAKKTDECNALLVQATYLALFLAASFFAMMQFLAPNLGMFGIDREVAGLAGIYLSQLSWSLFPFLVFTSVRQYLQAMNTAFPIFVIYALANIVNALANAAFVWGYWGFEPRGIGGSGLATCLARAFMLGAVLVYLFWHNRRKGLALGRAPRAVDFARLKKLIKLGLPAGGQILLEAGAFTAATLLAGRLGAVPLAAHQIALQIASTLFMIPVGLGSATAVRVGQSLGAGQGRRAVEFGWTGIIFGAAFMAFSGLVTYLLSDPILRVFTSDAEIIKLGAVLLGYVALFQLSDGTQVIGAGVLRGTGNTRLSMYANFVGHWMIGLPLGYTLCFTLGWGAPGLWIGLSAGLTAVAIALVAIWWRKAKLVAG